MSCVVRRASCVVRRALCVVRRMVLCVTCGVVWRRVASCGVGWCRMVSYGVVCGVMYCVLVGLIHGIQMPEENYLQ